MILLIFDLNFLINFLILNFIILILLILYFLFD